MIRTAWVTPTHLLCIRFPTSSFDLLARYFMARPSSAGSFVAGFWWLRWGYVQLLFMASARPAVSCSKASRLVQEEAHLEGNIEVVVLGDCLEV